MSKKIYKGERGKKMIIYQPKGKAGEYAEYAVNLYTGCIHGCSYCWVPGLKKETRTQFKTNVRPRKDIIGKLEADCKKFEDREKRILFCFTSDPYQKIENNITSEALKVIKKYKLNFLILTKGFNPERDFRLYKKNDIFGVTLTFLNPKLSKRYEPFASLPAERIKALKEAKNCGIETWVSLEPVIDAGQTLGLIEETHEHVDEYKLGKLNYEGSKIDWANFAKEAIRLFQKYHKKFYIKKDLEVYIKNDRKFRVAY